jgi:hypothetical protein
LLNALVQDPSSQPAHEESYRLFHLYHEIFCDRAALIACGDLHAAVSTLVKLETGITDVNAESYLEQTEEIFSKGTVKTSGLSHPECFIRTRALKLWSEQPANLEQDIRRMIEGGLSLDGMDLLAQGKTVELTRRLLETLLAEPWFRSEQVLAHARMFFDDLRVPKDAPCEDDLKPILEVEDEKLAQYFCYVLLDFVSCDRELEGPALGLALVLCRRLGLEKNFRPIATKELKLKKRQFDQLEQDAEAIVAAARKSEVTE